jgi:tetratricopeptide (TPR) repeat protein
MKVFLTAAIGFVFGLVISGVLGDLLSTVKNSIQRIYIAWDIAAAEKMYANENFDEASQKYETILKKINPNNKKLIAKTKNNLALSIFAQFEGSGNKDAEMLKKPVKLFEEALSYYEEMKDGEGSRQIKNNLGAAEKILSFLDRNLKKQAS